MRLSEKINNRRNEHHLDAGGHSHHHDHCNDNHCGCEEQHEHSHAHGCDCCEDGVVIDRRKTIAGLAVFIIAFVIFHIPGLFQSFDEQFMDNIELIVFLLIYLVTGRDIVMPLEIYLREKH